MSRKGQTITLSLSEQDKALLEALALEFGMMWGDRPNISRLVEAIARRQLQIAPNNNWSSFRLEALNLAVQALLDLGKIDEAREIAWLMSDRFEPAAPLRAELEQFLNQPLPPWRLDINRLIERQKPFRLAYRDAADRLCSYTVLHGQIVQIEKRQYLVCRCEEAGDEIKGLHHNWTLRLDRITEAAVASIDQPWVEDLERIPVELELRGGLAFAYRRKPEDQWISELEGDPPARKVVRNIFSTFWFFQEVSQYWQDCVIISPEAVRSHFQEKLTQMNQNYNILK